MKKSKDRTTKDKRLWRAYFRPRLEEIEPIKEVSVSSFENEERFEILHTLNEIVLFIATINAITIIIIISSNI